MTTLIHRLFATLLAACLLTPASAVEPNATDVSIVVPLIDGDGNLLDATALNSGAWDDVVINWRVGQRGAVQTASCGTLSEPNSTHSDYGGVMLWDGAARLDLSDAMWSAGANVVYVTLDLSAVDAGYCIPGGYVEVPIGYGLQQPDAGSGELARKDDTDALATSVGDVYGELGTLESQITSLPSAASTATAVWANGTRSITGTVTLGANQSAVTTLGGITVSGSTIPIPSATVQSGAAAALTAYDPPTHAELTSGLSPLATSSALSTVGTNVSTAVTQTTASAIRTGVGLASANLDTQLGAKASQASVDALPDDAAIQAAAKAGVLELLPDGATQIAAAGEDAKTLDEVEGGGGSGGTVATITQRVHAPNYIPFGRMTDGWYKAKRPIRVAVGSQPLIAADMREWGDMVWTGMDAPTTSDASVAEPGDVASDTYGISTTKGTPAFKLSPDSDAEAGDTCVVTVQAIADGQPVRLDFDVEVVAGGVE